MRCKVCDYRLWNLKARQCPECGTAFSVSDYEFIPNSVQFCCPHCGQDYYGTGHKGHLVPEAFLCVKCGQPLHMNDMVLLPTEGIEEEQTEPQALPWLNRQHDGWWRSWWSTVKMSLTAPRRLIRSVPPDTPASQAWRFAIATLGIALAGGMAGFFILAFVAGMMSGGMGGGPGGFGLLAPVAVLAAWVALMLAGIVVWAAVAHVFLLMTGGTRYTFARTCEALCYSVGTTVLLLIPGCGIYLYWIWWLTSAAIMLKERQRVHAMRATLALMTLPMLMGVGIALTVWGVSRGPTFTATWPPPTTAPAPTTPSTADNQVLTLATSLNQYAENHGGHGPQHIALLVAAGQIAPESLVLPDSATTADKVPIGKAGLNAIQSGPDPAQAVAVRDAIASLPADVVAYRLGDFVFTYPGIDFNRCNRKLWTVIAWPDPDANPAGTPAEVTVGLLDGGTTRLYGAQMELFLADQNALRVKNGLAPLPYPATVRHGQPARVQAEQEP